MNRGPYVPSPPAEVDAVGEGDRWTLVFVRELAHSPERVWAALTEPEQLREWSPFDAPRDLGSVGVATLTMSGGDDSEQLPAVVRRADRPTVLEYTWGEDLLRWDLSATPSGTRLMLRHTVAGGEWVPRTAAGWHICLDVAERFLDGEPVGRIVGDDARQHGWDDLHDVYAERLGLEGAGWPQG